MEVITIESRAFKEILNQLEAIKEEVKRTSQALPIVDKWLDGNEAAALLKVTLRTLQTYRDQGKISFSQTGSKIYYKASTIEEFLQNHHYKTFKKNR